MLCSVISWELLVYGSLEQSESKASTKSPYRGAQAQSIETDCQMLTGRAV